MTDLHDKKILLIMPNFFGYERQISAKLRDKGAEVIFFGDRPSLNTATKVVTRIHPGLLKPWSDRYFRKLISSHPPGYFDFILVIKGEGMSVAITKELFAKFSRAKKIFYLWDSFRNSKGAFAKLPLFDSVLTFDPIDATSTPSVRFRPLFFADSYVSITASPDPVIDLLFVGTAHTDRYPILKRLQRALPDGARVHFYLFLASKLVFWGRRLMDRRLRGARYEEFKFTPLSASENAALFRQSLAIADVERKVQRGLTMRTLEVMASGKKLITTNADVKNYDFYDANNVLVIDRDRPFVPPEFLVTPFIPIKQNVLYRYSLESWLNEVFE
ncbi:hypothetical protein [Pigmentiphaga litoralis]|uniref:hypothetical protein n=1 Tax=Pigmentiphaga litoralis TaxID=516702 RepID=UPI00167769AA|nr:hypothetical protein [Pigmentiphaga litoralis]